MSFDMRVRERIKLEYTEHGKSFREQIRFLQQAHRPDYEDDDFMAVMCGPSWNKLVDNLRHKEREKFYELRKNEYPMDTIIDGLGFKTKHKYSDDIVYVLDMGAWKNTPRREIDETRERAYIAKKDDNAKQMFAWHKGVNPDWAKTYLKSRAYKACAQYVDNLTKKQQLALTLIRMMDYDDFVEGVGGKTPGYGLVNADQFVLDC
jgi:hypothetical protein